MKFSEYELDLIQDVADSNGIELRIDSFELDESINVGIVPTSDSRFRQLLVEVAIVEPYLGRKLALAKVDNLGKNIIYF